MGCSTVPVSGSNGAGSCGAAGVVPNVVAIGNRAICNAETRLGCTGGGGGTGACDGTGAQEGPAVPQPDARATIASVMTDMAAALAFPAARRRDRSNRNLSSINRPRDTKKQRLTRRICNDAGYDGLVQRSCP